MLCVLLLVATILSALLKRLTLHRAYRAPELLFSSGDYSTSVDIWSAGVLFAEMFLGKTLFEADSDIGQVCSIVKVLGTPTEENWPVMCCRLTDIDENTH